MRSFLANNAALFSRKSSSASLRTVPECQATHASIGRYAVGMYSNKHFVAALTFAACSLWDCKLQPSDLQSASLEVAFDVIHRSSGFGVRAKRSLHPHAGHRLHTAVLLRTDHSREATS